MNIPLNTTVTTTKVTDISRSGLIIGTHNGDDFKAQETFNGTWVASIHANGCHTYSGEGTTWGEAVDTASDTLATAVTSEASYS